MGELFAARRVRGGFHGRGVGRHDRRITAADSAAALLVGVGERAAEGDRTKKRAGYHDGAAALERSHDFGFEARLRRSNAGVHEVRVATVVVEFLMAEFLMAARHAGARIAKGDMGRLAVVGIEGLQLPAGIGGRHMAVRRLLAVGGFLTVGRFLAVPGILLMSVLRIHGGIVSARHRLRIGFGLLRRIGARMLRGIGFGLIGFGLMPARIECRRAADGRMPGLRAHAKERVSRVPGTRRPLRGTRHPPWLPARRRRQVSRRQKWNPGNRDQWNRNPGAPSTARWSAGPWVPNRPEADAAGPADDVAERPNRPGAAAALGAAAPGAAAAPGRRMSAAEG
ncbi:hypothetical protein AUC70_10590 [Methyloceanibacter stevinii]|uniref:Uncharacterized protein n=1 Tax=Methyloceanibacter stevinii TaxID=1774970 RepID=A0A1E3VL50_9HYPH|nr:hypothetical protein AUC70_10590 [Methyloceanibacter stevinii]